MNTRAKDALFGFALGTGALLITIVLANRYDLGRAAALFVFWGAGVALFLVYFAYVYLAEVIRAYRKGGSPKPRPPGPSSYAQRVRTFILFFVLGISALLAYALRRIYDFGILASCLVGIVGFVVLNGLFEAIERAVTKFLKNRNNP